MCSFIYQPRPDTSPAKGPTLGVGVGVGVVVHILAVYGCLDDNGVVLLFYLYLHTVQLVNSAADLNCEAACCL